MGHTHHHHHEHNEEKPLKEKLKILVTHWKEHNNSHLEEYRRWEQKSKEEGLIDIAELIKEVCVKTEDITTLYTEIEKLLS